jgi:hypothetical protein
VVQTGHYLVLNVTHIVNVASGTDRGNSLLFCTFRRIFQQESIFKQHAVTIEQFNWTYINVTTTTINKKSQFYYI